ncbi:unnamed protein product [Urochloa decumbens]|uniref:Uncharacterized protein n=1 Tax=Urochloa decumbens TaxID=240449 RepID=A0ABC8X1I0_9POAL
MDWTTEWTTVAAYFSTRASLRRLRVPGHVRAAAAAARAPRQPQQLAQAPPPSVPRLRVPGQVRAAAAAAGAPRQPQQPAQAPPPSVPQLRVPGQVRAAAAAAAAGAPQQVQQPQQPAQAPPRTYCTVPTMEAQKVIHGILSEANAVFVDNRCFTAIDDDTFDVHERTGVVLLSKHGREQAKPFPPEQRRAQLNQNLRWLGALIRSRVFRTQSRVPVMEIEDGLLHMLENDDISMWSVIRIHTSLLPITARVDCLLHLHDELVNVVATMDMNRYIAILGAIELPQDWYTLIEQNTITYRLIDSNIYVHQGPQEVQAHHALRYHRNPSAHGLAHAIPRGSEDCAGGAPSRDLLPPRFRPRPPAQPGQVPVQPEFVRWDIGLLHYATMPMVLHSFQRAMHDAGFLKRVNMQHLFAYTNYY